MLSEELLFIFFNEQKNTMLIGTDVGIKFSEYPVGQELLKFLELDLTEYDRRRNIIEEYIIAERKGRKSKKINQTIMALYNQIPEFKNLVRKPINVQEIIDFHELGSFLFATSKDIKEHPYCFFCMETETEIFSGRGLDLLSFQNKLKELIKFCFDQSYNDLLNQLTAQERYYMWKKRNLSPMFVVEHAENICRTNNVFLPYKLTEKEEELLYSTSLTQDTIDLVKNLKPQTMQLFYCSNPVQYALCEFETLVKINAKMKQCKRCGKYFLLKGDYNTDYCDRILPGEKLSCKKAIAINNRKKKVQEDLILKEYERAYKRNYARCTNHKMTKEDFRTWTDDAMQKREIASKEYSETNNPEILRKFKEYLGNK